ncbi:hypothetical protein CUN63_07805 [Pseudomonas sp. ACM7]|nr:hypothetical protein CUN63_07805 [Pseudomonas sp. ACM7]
MPLSTSSSIARTPSDFLNQCIPLCRSCRRLRSFDLENQSQKIAAFGSSYRDRSPNEGVYSYTLSI